MIELWALEIGQALGRMLSNPLIYWIIILLVIVYLKRVKAERHAFGVKITNGLVEIKQTFFISLIFSLLFSALSVMFGLILSFEILFVIAIVTILLSVTGSFQLLSAVYTIGIPFIIFMLLPLLPDELFGSIYTMESLLETQFFYLAILVSSYLMIDYILLF